MHQHASDAIAAATDASAACLMLSSMMAISAAEYDDAPSHFPVPSSEDGAIALYWRSQHRSYHFYRPVWRFIRDGLEISSRDIDRDVEFRLVSELFDALFMICRDLMCLHIDTCCCHYLRYRHTN
jgi:hypothetical protein